MPSNAPLNADVLVICVNFGKPGAEAGVTSTLTVARLLVLVPGAQTAWRMQNR